MEKKTPDYTAASAQYFILTPANDWSYVGYLEAMQTYLNADDTLLAMKSKWKKRFLCALKNADQDCQERKALAKQDASQFWTNFDRKRALQTTQSDVLVNTQLNALGMLKSATNQQANGLISRMTEVASEPFGTSTARPAPDWTESKVSSELNDLPEKRKFDSVVGETSTSGISSRQKMESETGDGSFDQVDSLIDYESDIDFVFEDSEDLLPEECVVVEEEVEAKLEQDS
ncbi:hypothetical protein BC938DRAFT_479117 [Jimgerdemannia flammicorona]|uniref:Uncharacterized protein n=1 Tax=Jimgerdemannia flammicorona TaxID=994334 RepID=A0A433QLJ9_9FUNG|nr:hypothetical protein BC938DRAFT_479117 [Jimgerdemannia flammicorona]